MFQASVICLSLGRWVKGSFYIYEYWGIYGQAVSCGLYTKCTVSGVCCKVLCLGVICRTNTIPQKRLACLLRWLLHDCYDLRCWLLCDVQQLFWWQLAECWIASLAVQRHCLPIIMTIIRLLCYCYKSRCWLPCDVWQQLHDSLLNVWLHEWLWSVLADHFAQWVAVKRLLLTILPNDWLRSVLNS